jgi:hypothetical protein
MTDDDALTTLHKELARLKEELANAKIDVPVLALEMNVCKSSASATPVDWPIEVWRVRLRFREKCKTEPPYQSHQSTRPIDDSIRLAGHPTKHYSTANWIPVIAE